MDKRGFIPAFAGVVLLIVLMFYNGMFMHGDPVE
jgi:hypothetical protein